MGKTLVLAEKPSVGRELARVLGCTQGRDGYIAGSKYIVTWALGHLVELADPEHYGKQYEKWSLETLPMLPNAMDLVVIKGTGKQFNVVKTLLKSSEVSELVVATDAGREGELVARWIIKKAGFSKPIKRLWISSQTDKSIREGFAKLRPSKEYDNLYESARCRAEADWLVGLNVTRALTCKFNAQLSAGRVQTPTLAMIVEREKEIRRFVPKDFYTISADMPGFTALWRDEKTGQNRIFSKEKADQLLTAVRGSNAVVADLKQEGKREGPPLLYDLTELQREANKRYSYSAKQTLNIIQRLYEVHKVLTYPRTDSKHLSSDLIPSLRDRLKAVASDYELAPYCKALLAKGVKTSKRTVDDSKVTDHHAIIPTEEFPRFHDFDSEERKIYDMVAKRFIAAFCDDYQYDQVTVRLDIKKESFFARGKTVKDPGWKAVYTGIDIEDGDFDPNDDLGTQSLPVLKKGQNLTVRTIHMNSGKTDPPARYTEGTLLSAMEHPGKFISDSSLRSVVDTAGGIGTPATRADIIEKLFAVNYIERKGKHIIPLSKGNQLIELVPEELRSPELTAKWEKRLTAISKGSEKSDPFLKEMRQFASHLVSRVKASDASYRHDNLTRTKCPSCGKFLLEINGKKGKMLACQDRECGYRQNLSYESNARCPNCHKRLTVRGEDDKRIYTCVCGFREKFDRFNEQLSEKKNQAGKREMEAYLRKQEEEQPQASAFALAWAKFAQQEGSEVVKVLEDEKKKEKTQPKKEPRTQGGQRQSQDQTPGQKGGGSRGPGGQGDGRSRQNESGRREDESRRAGKGRSDRDHRNGENRRSDESRQNSSKPRQGSRNNAGGQNSNSAKKDTGDPSSGGRRNGGNPPGSKPGGGKPQSGKPDGGKPNQGQNQNRGQAQNQSQGQNRGRNHNQGQNRTQKDHQ